MVTFRVKSSQHIQGRTPRGASPRDLPIPSFFSPHIQPQVPNSLMFKSYLLSFQTLPHSFVVFCTHEKLNSFLFKSFHTLCAKHPGVGEGITRDRQILKPLRVQPSALLCDLRALCVDSFLLSGFQLILSIPFIFFCLRTLFRDGTHLSLAFSDVYALCSSQRGVWGYSSQSGTRLVLVRRYQEAPSWA